MKLKLKAIQNHGDYKEEFVLLEVAENCDIGEFLLADTTYTSSGKISNRLRHMCWLPDRAAKKGDVVRIFTKPGTTSSSTSASGTTTHNIYWGLETAVWNDEGDCAVLFEAAAWEHKGVS